MNIMLIIVICGISIFLISKAASFVLRPFFLAKVFDDIDMLYKKTKGNASADIEEAVINSKRVQDNAATLGAVWTEKESQDMVEDARKVLRREEEVYEKFLRCKERYMQSPEKLAEAITFYRRYLTVKLRQHQEATAFSKAIISEVITLDDAKSEATKTNVILDEAERKLNVLLG